MWGWIAIYRTLKKKGGGGDERSEFTVKQNTQMSD